MKGRNTRILSARVSEELYQKVKARAELRQKTINDWLLWAVNDGLRDRHGRKDGKAES
jgi:uncharacterized protein (DUF1778 family)